MKKIPIIIILIFLPINGYCQSKGVIYMDEDYKKISLKEFNRKTQSDLFLIARLENDTAIFKKLRYKEYFGRLDSKKKYQLNKLFQKRFDIDTTKTWLIHYQDSLPNIKLMPKISGIVYLDSTKKRHKHVLSFDTDKRIIPRELRKYRRIKNVQLVHFYQINKGYPAITKKYKWLKDPNTILKRTFTDGVKMYRLIIIHPNGDFYLSSIRKLFSDEKKLFKIKVFNKLQKEWQKKVGVKY